MRQFGPLLGNEEAKDDYRDGEDIFVQMSRIDEQEKRQTVSMMEQPIWSYVEVYENPNE